MTAQFRPLVREDIPQLTRLLDDVFTIRNPDKRGLIEWKYYHPVFHNNTIQYGAFSGGHLLAHYASIPVTVSARGLLLSASFCVDMASHPSARGQGFITKLSSLVYEQAKRQGIALTIGFSNEAGVQVDRNSRNYGYHIVGPFRSYYMVPISKTGSYTLEECTSFDAYDPGMTVSAYNAIHKTAEYLNWRYRDNPNHRYRFLQLLASGDCKGYVVLAQTRTRVHVVDILTMLSSVEDMKAIIQSINAYVRRHGFRPVVYSVLDNTFWKSVFRTISLTRASLKVHRYFLTVKFHDEKNIDPTRFLDPDSWMCFVGDVL